VYVTQAAGAALSRSETSLLSAMNRARTSRGLRPLVVDARLDTVAREHSRWMLRSGQFSHGDFGSRILGSHAAGRSFGENLAWGTGRRRNAEVIVAEWLASPEHRANLLRAGYRRVGLGRLSGRFGGASGAVLVTADFAG
jgi:uncharacterized protein YkwD